MTRRRRVLEAAVAEQQHILQPTCITLARGLVPVRRRLSLFDDKASAEESNRRAADWVHQNIAELLPNPPHISEGNVVAP